MDILMRYFLVAPRIEKIHLRGLILLANREIKKLGLSGSPTTDQDDAKAIVQAYVHLLTPPLRHSYIILRRLRRRIHLERFCCVRVTGELGEDH